LADLAAYGADASCLPESITTQKEFKVWAEHEDAVAMFLRIQTQWRTGPNGVIGLDYGILLGPGNIFDLYSVESPRQTLEDLQVMEARAKELINPKPETKKRGR